MGFEIRKAVRRALPLQMAFVGPTNSGKTLSALLFAAGLSKSGRVVVIDTEKGRAELYADNQRVLKALPNGFDVIPLDPPYHPERFIGAINTAEAAGYEVCLIDSASDEWDGLGACTDIAEADGNQWNRAKLWNKRFMNRIALSNMHVICCLKAHEKTKIIDKKKSASGKTEYIDLGMQPIWEKNNFYPMTLAFMFDPNTHLATNTKTHDDLIDKFRQPRLITKEDGVIVRQWIEGGKALEAHEQLSKRARSAAEEGIEAYKTFWSGLTNGQRAALKSQHEANKKIAEESNSIPTFGSLDQQVNWPDSFDGPELMWNGKHLKWNEDTGNYAEVSEHAGVAA